MDPDMVLAEIKATCNDWIQARDDAAAHDAAADLVELVEALDQWLFNGGFLPRAWDGNR